MQRRTGDPIIRRRTFGARSIVDIDGRNLQRLTAINEDVPVSAWSPDGREIAWLGGGSTVTAQAGVSVINSSGGGGILRLTVQPGHRGLDWTLGPYITLDQLSWRRMAEKHTERLVTTRTEDGYLLEGARFTPVEAHPLGSVVVWMHGFTGRFYEQHTLAIGRRLADRGHTFITGNNRGHDFGRPFTGLMVARAYGPAPGGRMCRRAGSTSPPG